MRPAVGRRVADDDHRGARGGALDESDERRELAVRRERALEMGGLRALPGGLGPGGRPHLAARAIGEGRGRRPRCAAAGARTGRRSWRAPAGARPGSPRRPRAGRSPDCARSHASRRAAGAGSPTRPGRCRSSTPGVDRERAAGPAPATAAPRERSSDASGAGRRAAARGRGLGVGSERRLERTAGGREPRERRRPPRLLPRPEAVREHEHDAPRRRRFPGRRQQHAGRRRRERQYGAWSEDRAAVHWPVHHIRPRHGGSRPGYALGSRRIG